ncbi:MAG: carboxyltransferase domain-containing protein [Pirellulaceae bacterium]
MSNWLPLGDSGLVINNFANEFLLVRRQPATGPLADFSLPAWCGQFLEQQSPLASIVNIIATEVEVCVQLAEQTSTAELGQVIAELTSSLAAWRDEELAAASARIWRLPVCFSEYDWIAVEQASGLLRSEVIERLLQTRLQVAMFGFLPGFVYLTGLAPDLHIPRKATPDVRSPRGALALGGPYVGVYSLPSPAGWHVIGTIGVELLEIDRLPPIVLRPGDHVELQSISIAQLTELQSSKVNVEEFNS